MGEFLGSALRYFPFFVTGIDESQVLLAVIVESKWTIVGYVFHRLTPRVIDYPWVAFLPHRWGCIPGWRQLQVDIIAYALGCLQGDILTGAQPTTEFSVVDCLATKGGLGDTRATAIGLHLLQ
jgi:hypothetical protein